MTKYHAHEAIIATGPKTDHLPTVTDVEEAVTAERERIKRLLSTPLLAALRCIPDGRIQTGCVIHNGATVRERVRQAYRAIDGREDQP